VREQPAGETRGGGGERRTPRACKRGVLMPEARAATSSPDGMQDDAKARVGDRPEAEHVTSIETQAT